MWATKLQLLPNITVLQKIRLQPTLLKAVHAQSSQTAAYPTQAVVRMRTLNAAPSSSQCCCYDYSARWLHNFPNDSCCPKVGVAH